MDYIEKYLMTRLHPVVFCPATTDDEERDLATQTRIRSLHWINIHLLDAAIDETQPEVQDLVDHAITGKRSSVCGLPSREAADVTP